MPEKRRGISTSSKALAKTEAQGVCLLQDVCPAPREDCPSRFHPIFKTVLNPFTIAD